MGKPLIYAPCKKRNHISKQTLYPGMVCIYFKQTFVINRCCDSNNYKVRIKPHSLPLVVTNESLSALVPLVISDF